MNSGRIRPAGACLLAIAILAVAPTTALGNPLLSGYGGPGQGEQALLGGGLVNGPSGPSSGAGSTATATASPERPTETGTARSPSTSGGARAHGVSPARGSRQHSGGSSARGSSAGALPTYTYQGGLSASRSSAGSSQVLGLSGEDVLYIVLALGAVLATGALTRRLVRQPARRAG